MNGDLLTVAETCARLGISRHTFYDRLKDGTLHKAGLREANRITRKRLFDAASVNTVLWKRTTTR